MGDRVLVIRTGIVVSDFDATVIAAFNEDAETQEAFGEEILEILTPVLDAFDLRDVVAAAQSDARIRFTFNVRTTLSLEEVLALIQALLATAAVDGKMEESLDDLIADGAVIPGTATILVEDTVREIAAETEIDELATPVPTLLCFFDEVTTLESARFSPDGASLFVAFTSATDQGDFSTGVPFDCAVIFEVEAICAWRNASFLEADISRTALTVGDAWTLRGRTLKNACPPERDCECFPFAPEASIDIGAPVVAIVPVVVLQAPDTVGACSGLLVDAYLSFGGAGRPFSAIAWTLVAPDHVEDDEVTALLGDLNTSSLELRLDRDQLEFLLAAGVRSLEASVVLTNFFAETGDGRTIVALSEDPSLPFVRIVGGDQRQLFIDTELSVVATAEFISCDGNDVHPLSYEWDLSQVGTLSNDDPRELYLPPFSLAPGTRYDLTVRVRAMNTTNTATVVIETLDAPAIAVISGGDRGIVSLAGIEAISAATSRDPDDVLTYQWTCTNLELEEDASCDRAIIGGTAAEETLLLDKSEVGFTTFQVTLAVNNATDTVEITHLLEAPSVTLEGPVGPVASNRRLVLDGDITIPDDGALNATFSLVSGALRGDVELKDVARTSVQVDFGFVVGPNVLSLVVNPYSLVPGATYTFELAADLAGSFQTGFARVDVVVARPPAGGFLTVSPRTGVALTTRYDLEATEWTTDAFPLRYRFSTDRDVVLRVTSLDSVARDIFLPQAPTCADGDCQSTVNVIVEDANGATANATDVVTVLAPTMDLDEIQDLLEAALDLFDYEATCDIIVAAARAAPSDGDLVAILVDAVRSARTLSRGSDDQTSLFTACLAEAIADANALFRLTAEVALKEITGILTDAESQSFLFSDSATIRAVEVLSQLLATSLFFNEGNESYTGRSASVNISGTIDLFALGILTPLALDEFPTVVRDANLEIAVFRSAGRTSTEVSTSRGSAVLDASWNGTIFELVVSDFLINTHRLELDGGSLTADSVLRVVLLIDTDDPGRRRLQEEPLRKVQLTLPTEDAKTPAPTAAPLRSNVSLTCPWNYEGTVSAVCDADGSVVSLDCTGTKQELERGCGSTQRDTCVSWETSEWDPFRCTVNTDLSTATSTVCDCDVDVTTSRNDTAAKDFSSRNVLETYAEIFRSELFGGDFHYRNTIVIIICLCAFVVLTAILIAIAVRVDRYDPAWQAHIPPPKVVHEDLEEEEEEEEVAMADAPETTVDETEDVAPDDYPTPEDWIPPSGAPSAPDDQSPEILEEDVVSRSYSERISIARRILDIKETWFSQFTRVIYYRHPFLSIWTVFRYREPRWTRVVILAFEMLLLAGALAFELRFEYPDPNCRKKESRERCLDRETISGRTMCKWNEDDGECSWRGPPTNGILTLEHFLIIMLTTFCVMPFLIAFEWSFRIASSTRCFDIQPQSLDEEKDDDGSGGAPPVAEEMYEGKVVLRGIPRERSERATRWTTRRARLQFKSRSLVRAAESRVDNVVALVKARRRELREDITSATAEGTVFGSRKARILYNIEREFEKKWGWTSDDLLLRANVLYRVTKSLRLARRWEVELESVTDSEVMKRRLNTYAVTCRLSTRERRIYERIIFYDDVDDDEVEQPTWLRLGAGTLTIALMILPAAYLIIFAANGGVAQSYALLVEFGFVFFIIFLLLVPAQLVVSGVALPNLIRDKLEHNPKLNLAQYPFTADLPEDALDYLLEGNPHLRMYLPEPTDTFTRHLRGVRKENLTLEMLEEINRDLHWRSVTTTALGLILATVFINLPTSISDAVVEELLIASPIGCFFIFRPVLTETIGATIALLLLTLALTWLLIFGIASVVAALHRRTLVQRDLRYERDRQRTLDFIAKTGGPETKLPHTTDDDDDDIEEVPSPPQQKKALTPSASSSRRKSFFSSSGTTSKELRSPKPY